MKITKAKLATISVPLRTPFKTALRTVNSVENIIVELHTDSGLIGYGEAPPTAPITGETKGSLIGALENHIVPSIIGKELEDFNSITKAVQKSIVNNTSFEIYI